MLLTDYFIWQAVYVFCVFIKKVIANCKIIWIAKDI